MTVLKFDKTSQLQPPFASTSQGNWLQKKPTQGNPGGVTAGGRGASDNSLPEYLSALCFSLQPLFSEEGQTRFYCTRSTLKGLVHERI